MTGGRLDYIDQHAAAALVYHRNGHVINVFVWPIRSGDDAKSLMARRNGLNLMAWNNSGMQFWVVSDVNLEELQRFSKLLRDEGV